MSDSGSFCSAQDTVMTGGSDLEMDCATEGLEPEVAEVDIADLDDPAASVALPGNDDLRCPSCSEVYNGADRSMMSGECGHGQCLPCWESKGACFPCNQTSAELHSAFPTTARDLMSPEPLDVPRASDSGLTDPSNKMATNVATAPVMAASVGGGASASQSGTLTTGTSTAALNKMATNVATAPVKAASVGGASASQSGTLTPGISTASLNSAVSGTTPFGFFTGAAMAQPSYKAAPAMDVNVVCMNGTKIKTRVQPNATVGEFKTEVHRQSGISAERQTLLSKGRTMSKNQSSLKSYAVESGSTVQMTNRTTGG